MIYFLVTEDQTFRPGQQADGHSDVYWHLPETRIESFNRYDIALLYSHGCVSSKDIFFGKPHPLDVAAPALVSIYLDKKYKRRRFALFSGDCQKRAETSPQPPFYPQPIACDQIAASTLVWLQAPLPGTFYGCTSLRSLDVRRLNSGAASSAVSQSIMTI